MIEILISTARSLDKTLDSISTSFSLKAGSIINPRLESRRGLPANGVVNEFLINDKMHINVEYLKCQNLDQSQEGGSFCKEIFIKIKNDKFKLQIINLCPEYGCLIVTVKEFDNQIWIAFGSGGEYDWRGDGFQVYDKNSHKLLLSYGGQGVESLLVNDFVKNSNSGNIFVSTNRGIREFDSEKLQLKSSMFFYYDFSPLSGNVELFSSNTDEPDRPFTIMANDLGFGKDKRFYEALGSNFKQDKITYSNGSVVMSKKQLSSLEPLVIEALKSKDERIKRYASYLVANFKTKNIANSVYDVIMSYPAAELRISTSDATYWLIESYAKFYKSSFYSSEQILKMNNFLSNPFVAKSYLDAALKRH